MKKFFTLVIENILFSSLLFSNVHIPSRYYLRAEVTENPGKGHMELRGRNAVVLDEKNEPYSYYAFHAYMSNAGGSDPCMGVIQEGSPYCIHRDDLTIAYDKYGGLQMEASWTFPDSTFPVGVEYSYHIKVVQNMEGAVEWEFTVNGNAIHGKNKDFKEFLLTQHEIRQIMNERVLSAISQGDLLEPKMTPYFAKDYKTPPEVKKKVDKYIAELNDPSNSNRRDTFNNMCHMNYEEVAYLIKEGRSLNNLTPEQRNWIGVLINAYTYEPEFDVEDGIVLCQP